MKPPLKPPLNTPRKQCPKCKAVMHLHVPTCFWCRHTFRTRFRPDGKPIRAESTPISTPVPTPVPASTSSPGFAAPSYTPPPFSSELDPTVSLIRRNAPWIGVVVLLLIGFGYGALINLAFQGQRHAETNEIQRATEDRQGATQNQLAQPRSQPTSPQHLSKQEKQEKQELEKVRP